MHKIKKYGKIKKITNKEKVKMLETIISKEKNKIEKIRKSAETRLAVYIYIYIVYCHLENKDLKLKNIKYNCQKYNYISNFKKISTKCLLRQSIVLL